MRTLQEVSEDGCVGTKRISRGAGWGRTRRTGGGSGPWCGDAPGRRRCAVWRGGEGEAFKPQPTASILQKARRSLSRSRRVLAERTAGSICSRCVGDSGVSRTRRSRRRMRLIGVGIARLIVARKSLGAWLAAQARRLASRRSVSRISRRAIASGRLRASGSAHSSVRPSDSARATCSRPRQVERRSARSGWRVATALHPRRDRHRTATVGLAQIAVGQGRSPHGDEAEKKIREVGGNHRHDEPGGAGRQGREPQRREQAVGGFTEGEKNPVAEALRRPVAPLTSVKPATAQECARTAPGDGESASG